MAVEYLAVVLTIGVATLVLLVVAYLARNQFKSEHEQGEEPSTEQEAKLQNGIASKLNKKQKGKDFRTAQWTHSWLLTSLKGHSGRVLDVDFSSNGRNLISCAEDRTLMLWSVKDFAEREHKTVRGNVELDHARLVQFAPDCKSIVLCLSSTNTLAVYKIAKKDDGGHKIQPVDGIAFPPKHDREITHIGISCSGRFLMSASDDTKMVVWSLRGDVLKEIDTKSSQIHHAAVSPCGRFVAASGFTPDVKVWEVVFDYSKTFVDVVRAFELKGHSSGVYTFAFNQNSSRAVTASKDGTWRLYDTDIRYQHGEDPHLLSSGTLQQLKTADPEFVRLAMAPDGDSFALSINKRLSCFDVTDADKPTQIDDVHTDTVTAIRFSNDGKYIATSGDRHIRVFHNVCGYKVQVTRLKQELSRQSHGDARKRRLAEQIEAAETALKTVITS